MASVSVVAFVGGWIDGMVQSRHVWARRVRCSGSQRAAVRPAVAAVVECGAPPGTAKRIRGVGAMWAAIPRTSDAAETRGRFLGPNNGTLVHVLGTGTHLGVRGRVSIARILAAAHAPRVTARGRDAILSAPERAPPRPREDRYPPPVSQLVRQRPLIRLTPVGRHVRCAAPGWVRPRPPRRLPEPAEGGCSLFLTGARDSQRTQRCCFVVCAAACVGNGVSWLS